MQIAGRACTQWKRIVTRACLVLIANGAELKHESGGTDLVVVARWFRVHRRTASQHSMRECTSLLEHAYFACTLSACTHMLHACQCAHRSLLCVRAQARTQFVHFFVLVHSQAGICTRMLLVCVQDMQEHASCSVHRAECVRASAHTQSAGAC